MGFYHVLRRQLASADVAVASVGHSALWIAPRRPSPDQFAVACREHSSPVSGFPSADSPDVAVRCVGRAFRLASIACRICRLDRRTQGCVEWIFLDADNLGVCALRAIRSSRLSARNSKFEVQTSTFKE